MRHTWFTHNSVSSAYFSSKLGNAQCSSPPNRANDRPEEKNDKNCEYPAHLCDNLSWRVSGLGKAYSSPRSPLIGRPIQMEGQAKGAYVNIISCDVTHIEAASKMVEEATESNGSVYALFCCAGAAVPGFFMQQTPRICADQMNLNYLGVVNCIHPAVQNMIEHKTRGRLVIVSSTLGLMGLVGYSQYSATKFALRGLAESLRQELLPHGIRAHIYFVATINTPGNRRENELKPAITKKIEEGDISDDSPASRASILLRGVLLDEFAISSDPITCLFLAASLGACPGSTNVFRDILLIPLAHWMLTLWRNYADWLVLRAAATKTNSIQN